MRRAGTCRRRRSTKKPTTTSRSGGSCWRRPTALMSGGRSSLRWASGSAPTYDPLLYHILHFFLRILYLCLKWQHPQTPPPACVRARFARMGAGACNVNCAAESPLPTLPKYRLRNCRSFSLYRAHFTCRVRVERYSLQVFSTTLRLGTQMASHNLCGLSGFICIGFKM